MTTEPRSLLLNRYAGWRAATLDHVTLANEEAELRLGWLPSAKAPLADPRGTFGGLALPTGVAVDAQGIVYAVNKARDTLERLNPCTGLIEPVACIGGKGVLARRFNAPHGAAISPYGDLYIADTGNHRVQVFALKELALRSIWRSNVFPADHRPAVEWQPWDIAISEGCTVYVSDYANGLIHVFSARGRWRESWAGDPARPLVKPTDLALDRAGRLYIVEEGKNEVTVLDPEGGFVERATRVEQMSSRFCPPPAGINGSGAVEVSAETTFFREGRFVSTPLDSRIYQCPWHRIVLRASIPDSASVRVETMTSEAAKTREEISSLPDSRWETAGIHDEVGQGDWDCLVRSQPGRYLWLRLTLTGNGIETPAITRAQTFFPRATSLQYLPAVYSDDAESRQFLEHFLSMFDTISGAIGQRISDIALLFDPGATPADSGDDFLTWLASWLGLAFDQNLPERRRRGLLRNAHRLYRLRGTPEGLRLHIRLYTGRDANILEHFRLRRWMFVGSGRLGAASRVWGDDIVKRLQLDEHARVGTFQLVDSGDPLRDPFHQFAHQFTVFVGSRGGDEDAETHAIQRVLELSKPAYTQGFVKLLQPRFRIGVESYLGMNTAIGQYPGPVVLGQNRAGYDAMLGESPARPPTMRIGTASRIGSSTRID